MWCQLWLYLIINFTVYLRINSSSAAPKEWDGILYMKLWQEFDLQENFNWNTSSFCHKSLGSANHFSARHTLNDVRYWCKFTKRTAAEQLFQTVRNKQQRQWKKKKKLEIKHSEQVKNCLSVIQNATLFCLLARDPILRKKMSATSGSGYHRFKFLLSNRYKVWKCVVCY